MVKLTPEQIAELKAQHGDLYLFEIDDPDLAELAEVVVKAPSRQVLGRFQQDAIGGKAYRATTTLLYDCLVYPDAAVVRSVEERYPGIALNLGGKVAGLSKAAVEVLEKKL